MLWWLRRITRGHNNGVVAVGHTFSYAGAMALIEAGADGLTHVFLDKADHEQLDALTSRMRERGAHCNPTLGLCASQTGEGEDLRQKFVRDPFAQRLLADHFKTPPKAIGFASAQKPRSSIENAYKATRSLYKAGVPIVVGSDAAGKGIGTSYRLGVHMELFLLVSEIGMSPAEALRCATSIPAKRFGLLDRGVIQKGRKADLILIGCDISIVMVDKRPQCLPIKAVWRDRVSSSVST